MARTHLGKPALITGVILTLLIVSGLLYFILEKKKQQEDVTAGITPNPTLLSRLDRLKAGPYPGAMGDIAAKSLFIPGLDLGDWIAGSNIPVSLNNTTGAVNLSTDPLIIDPVDICNGIATLINNLLSPTSQSNYKIKSTMIGQLSGSFSNLQITPVVSGTFNRDSLQTFYELFGELAGTIAVVLPQLGSNSVQNDINGRMNMLINSIDSTVHNGRAITTLNGGNSFAVFAMDVVTAYQTALQQQIDEIELSMCNIIDGIRSTRNMRPDYEPDQSHPRQGSVKHSDGGWLAPKGTPEYLVSNAEGDDNAIARDINPRFGFPFKAALQYRISAYATIDPNAPATRTNAMRASIQKYGETFKQAQLSLPGPGDSSAANTANTINTIVRIAVIVLSIVAMCI